MYLFPLLLLFHLVAATCYFRDGSPVTAPDYLPCHQGTDSMCCATNATARPGWADVCLDDGLCNSPSYGTYWREGCTDPTWLSENCLSNICTDVDENGEISTDAQLTQCVALGGWCCGNLNQTQCCNSPDKFELAATLLITSSASSASSNSSPTSTSSSSSSTSSQTASTASRTSATATTTAKSGSPRTYDMTGGIRGVFGVIIITFVLW